MILQTKGIVVRKVKYGESSLIVDIYTEAIGLQTFIINGVRSKRAKAKASHFNLMTLLDLQCYHQSEKKINRIKEFTFAQVYQNIPFDFVRANIGLFMCELLTRSIREQENNGALFEFLRGSFLYLDSDSAIITNLHLYFALQLTHYLGFGIADEYDEDVPYFDIRAGEFVHRPPWHNQYLNQEQSRLLSYINNLELEQLDNLKLNRYQRNEVVDNVLSYYRYHIDQFGEMKSHKVLQEVFD